LLLPPYTRMTPEAKDCPVSSFLTESPKRWKM
jgi:hypothetical protein